MLNLRHNGTVIDTVFEGSTFRLPDGRYVSPAMQNWTSGDGYSLTVVPQPPAPSPEEQLEQARLGMRLSFAQLIIGLVTEAWITEAEGEGWITGTLPAAVLAVINGLPEGQRFAAKARALRPSEVLRSDPLVGAMGVSAGKTPAQIDTFFLTYGAV